MLERLSSHKSSLRRHDDALSSSFSVLINANSYPFVTSLGCRPMTNKLSAFFSSSPAKMITILVESPIYKSKRKWAHAFTISLDNSSRILMFSRQPETHLLFLRLWSHYNELCSWMHHFDLPNNCRCIRRNEESTKMVDHEFIPPYVMVCKLDSIKIRIHLPLGP